MAIAIQHFSEQEIFAANDILMAAFESQENRVDDLSRLLTLQPDGWFMALDEGKPVGTVGAVSYGAFAWIGMMAVYPEKQKCGIGKLLMQALIDWLEMRGNCISLLDATPLGEPLYRQFSFAEVDRVVQFVKYDHPARKEPDHSLGEVYPSLDLPKGIKEMTATDIPQVAEFDAPFFGADRRAVFQVYLHDYPKRAFIAHTPTGKILGYLLVQDRKIGPWVAESSEAAELLLHAALKLDYPEGDPAVIAPASNARAESVLERNGFQAVRSLSHMQRGGKAPPSRREFIFGQTNFAIG